MMKRNDGTSNSSRAEKKVQAKGNDVPKFGRLLIVLLLVIVAIGFIVMTSEAYYS